MGTVYVCLGRGVFTTVVLGTLWIVIGTLYLYENPIQHRLVSLTARRNLWSGSHGQTQTKVVLLAYMRSGSTFTGNLIQQSADVFYVFEPLYSVAKHSESGVSKEFTMDGNILQSSFPKKQTHVLDKILDCNFTSLDFYTLTQHHMVNSHSTKEYFNCVQKNKNIAGVQECISEMTGQCRHSAVVAVKVIKAQMSHMRYFLSAYPHFKVIHLLRDPRGILRSMKRVGQVKEGYAVAAESKCNDMLRDIKISRKLKTDFPGRILTIRYEDLSYKPFEVVRDIYTFLGLEFTPEIREYIFNVTRSDDVSCGAMCTEKNSEYTAFRWRGQYSFSDVIQIDKHCSDVYEKAGYLQIPSQNVLVNMTQATIVVMPIALKNV